MVLAPESQRPPLRHGVDGIEYQIGKHFAQIRCMDGGIDIGLKIPNKLDSGAVLFHGILPARAGQFHGIFDDVGDIHH